MQVAAFNEQSLESLELCRVQVPKKNKTLRSKTQKTQILKIKINCSACNLA